MDIPTSNHHVGSTERVFVAHVNDLNDFYLHSESVHDSLIKLGGDLYNEYSESLTKSTDLNKSFRVNDYCVCPSDSEDWYRGLIRQLDSNGLATVFKIDYGDVQDVPIQFLQPLKEQYFKIPRLAFHCSLANLLKPNDGWPIDIIKEFRSRLTTTFLYAQFMNYNEIRDISDVEITEKSSKTSLNKDFEQYQLDSSTLKINDKLIYKDIPMDSLDSIQPNQIRLLYYLNPSQFYVYFPDKTNSHLSFQTDLQNAIQYFRPLSSTVKHQPIVVKDNQAIWHRAIALDPIPNKQKLTVYFLDIGRREYVSMENIRALSEEFYRKPAFAIPCSLSNLCPMNSNEQTWKSNDPVHSEFNRLMVHTLSCHVRCKHDQLIYDVEIDIPKIGDLATFLVNKQLVSRSIMRSSQPTRYSSGQPPQNTFVRQQLVDAGLTPFRAQQQGQQRFSQTNPIRMTNPTVQTSSSIPTVPPQDGSYKIIQIRNAGEFYGLSQSRESEYMAVSKRLTDYYNNLSNESLLRDNLIMEGMPYAIQDGDKYHRVIVKHRDSETRVTVKFVDRGDESFVDITELLQIEPALSKIPAFAQPFRLRGYEDSQNSSNMTQNLKKLISNQIVRITPSGQSHNGCYDVEVSTNNNQSVNRIILNNEKLPIQQSTSSSLNRPSGTHIESQVFSNSSRHNQNQDFQGSRINDTLPAPQKILTAQPQVNRFGAGPNQTSSSSNEQTPRFASFANRNTSTQNNEPNKPGFHTSQQPFGRQPQNSMQRNDENRPATNTNNRFQSDGFGNHQQSTFDQKRSFNNNNNERNDSGSRPGGSFSNRGRGEGFERSDRFTNRNNNEERNENNSYSSSSTGAFQRRGGGGAGGGYHDSNNGNRGGGSHGEYGGHRDYGDNNDSGRRGGRGSYQDFSNGNRGGGSRGGGSHGEYRGHRDYGDNNDSGQRGGRGGRGGPRGGPHSDRGGASFRTRGDSDLQLSSGAPTSTFSNYPNARIPVQFDSGNEFPETILPKELFKFVVSYIETANDFFIQSVSKGDELSSLNETLQVEYRKSPEMGLSSYKKDQACLAKSTTYGCWYRAIVLSTGVSQVKIRFVDFGDVQDVDSANIRPIAKEHCSKSPYAYPCTFSNVEVVKETEKEKAISQCEEKEFNGKILNKTSEGKYILECDSLLQALISINAIKETKAIEKISKPKTTICSIVHVEVAEREFYVQEDLDTVDAIANLVAEEDQTNSALSIDEVNQLEANTIIIAKYNEEPFRAIIKSKESDEQLSVYFVDYGNTSSCPIDSTKRASEKLSKYPYQAKRCRLHGIPSDKLDKAYERLSEQADDEAVEISIIDENDQTSNVLVYIENQCLNEQFGYNPNQSSPTEQNTLATNAEETVPETNVEETIPATNVEETTSSTNVEENTADVEEMAPSTDVEQKPVESVEEEQTKDSTSKTRSARLVHVEKARPYVYLQFMPECDDNLGEINDIIAHIVDENKRNSTYEVGQKIVAKFSEDEQHYRARIESYSSSTETYKIYFLDYGNMDENVTSENFYSYSEQLEAFEGQAHDYLLGNIPSDQWTDEKRLLVESYINSDVQFKFIDENQSTIHIEFPDAEQIYSNEINQSTLEITNDDKKILQANICSADKSCFYIHILPEDNLHLGEIEELLQTCEKQKQDSWSINDKCIVSNDNDKYFRGQIREICDNKYDVQCIDYGSILTNRTVDQLFQLPNDDLCQQQALAHQCRLFSYADDDQQENLINQRIRTIPDVETVKIVVENRTDSCLYVTVIRENNENINQQESDKDMNGETSHISQSLSTLSITNNQTIDFGENDTSTTTLVDQTNNSMLTD